MRKEGTQSTLLIPPPFQLINDPAEDISLGNLLLLQADQERRVLKVYKRRRSHLRELMACFSHRFLEGKRGPDPVARQETERVSLSLWSEHGFRVPRLLEGDPPSWIEGAPFLWLSFVEGRRLYLLLLDPEVEDAEKERLVRDMAQEDQRRHRLALDLKQPMLLHEHPTTKHKLVVDGDLVTIDLEGGYAKNYPALLAIGYEIAGIVRSMWVQASRPCFEEQWPRTYLDAYEDRDLLREVCAYNRRSMRARGKWLNDRWRGKSRSKSSVLEQLDTLIN